MRPGDLLSMTPLRAVEGKTGEQSHAKPKMPAVRACACGRYVEAEVSLVELVEEVSVFDALSFDALSFDAPSEFELDALPSFVSVGLLLVLLSPSGVLSGLLLAPLLA
jgi:hypothetical protein